MIPTRYDYYRACAREHRVLAQRAANEQSTTDTPPTEAEAPQPDAKPTDEDPPASDGQARPGAPTP